MLGQRLVRWGARPNRLAASGPNSVPRQSGTYLVHAALWYISSPDLRIIDADGEVTEGEPGTQRLSLRHPQTPKTPLSWSATLCQLSYSHGCATVAAGAAGLDCEAARDGPDGEHGPSVSASQALACHVGERGGVVSWTKCSGCVSECVWLTLRLRHRRKGWGHRVDGIYLD